MINQEKQDAVITRIMIIGEATKQISDDLRQQYQHIPWKNMAGMRDILIHRYHGIDLEIIWEVIKVELPEIENDLMKISKKLKRS
ncbi:HepT-like ribonuclease domain-containing protein [Natronospora cellulosivora (SeqCode)]